MSLYYIHPLKRLIQCHSQCLNVAIQYPRLAPRYISHRHISLSPALSRTLARALTHTHAHMHALSCSKLNQFAVKNTEQRMNKTVAKSQLSKNCMLPKVASHGERIIPFVTGITFKTLKVQIIT